MKRQFLKLFLSGFIANLLFGLVFQTQVFAEATAPLKYLAVQDAGRIKPFDTFSRESLELVYGKAKYENKPAFEIIMTWMLQPQIWQDKKLFEIKHHLVKRFLGLKNEDKYFSLQELLANEKLSTLFQDLNSKRETKEKLDPYFQAIQRLENQIYTFREIASGRMIRLIPDAENSAWKDLTALNEAQQLAFIDVTKAFVQALNDNGNNTEAEAHLKNAVDKFKALAMESAPNHYPSEQKISTEVHYNSFHPFKWAWIFYFLSALTFIVYWISKKKITIPIAWILSICGLAFHIYGFSLRVYLSERAPVSNMYETVVWVSLGTVIFSMIIEAIYKWRLVLLAGTAVGAFCLILTDFAPTVLDGSIQPLEPVLRSNFWLTIHVLTITISYAAFFLAFALGDIGLWFFFRDEKKYEDKIKALVIALYRAIQIGVALLGPGIILGGIWADYSWGRFWGWDPKETWALIALLGYLAALHARLAGLLKNFGMVVTAILTFSLVIMAWYGVNFVLGAGLHSYGFGAGGVEYVSGFVALHILAVIFVSVLRWQRLRE